MHTTQGKTVVRSVRQGKQRLSEYADSAQPDTYFESRLTSVRKEVTKASVGSSSNDVRGTSSASSTGAQHVMHCLVLGSGDADHHGYNGTHLREEQDGNPIAARSRSKSKSKSEKSWPNVKVNGCGMWCAACAERQRGADGRGNPLVNHARDFHGLCEMGADGEEEEEDGSGAGKAKAKAGTSMGKSTKTSSAGAGDGKGGADDFDVAPCLPVGFEVHCPDGNKGESIGETERYRQLFEEHFAEHCAQCI